MQEIALFFMVLSGCFLSLTVALNQFNPQPINRKEFDKWQMIFAIIFTIALIIFMIPFLKGAEISFQHHNGALRGSFFYPQNPKSGT